jgi:hypothetical protein
MDKRNRINEYGKMVMFAFKPPKSNKITIKKPAENVILPQIKQN